MRVKETYISFSGLVNIGQYSFFINADKSGIDNDELIYKAVLFPRIIIEGDEPLNQKDELAKFVNKLVKENHEVKVDIFTKGMIKPKGIKQFDKIKFNVLVQLKNTCIEYKKRIDDKIYKYFKEANSNFIFFINNEDEFDEAKLIIVSLGLKRKNIYIGCNNYKKFDFVLKQARLNKYNFAPNFKRFLWNYEGRIKNE